MTRKELRSMLNLEKQKNIGNTSFRHLAYVFFTKQHCWMRWKYIKAVRYVSYLFEKAQKNKIYYILLFFWMRRKNKLGYFLGFEINGINIAPGLTLCHNGPIVIHGKSIIGSNCIFHGDNCVGNNGINDDCPIIGNNVDIGVGAKIIGNVKIADNVRIGAGAVVVKSINKEGATVVGVPAKIITE